MNATPRLRTDLEAQSVEEAGIKYFDVRDPRSGNKLRLYDFEWLIAGQLDGHKEFDDVASWAADKFGFRPSPADLKTYADKLQHFGLIEAASKGAAAAAASAEVSMEMDEEPEIETKPAPPAPKVTSPEAMRPTEAAVPVQAAQPAQRTETPSRPASSPEPAATKAAAPEPSGPSGSVIALLLLIVLGAVAVVYFKFLAEGPLQVKVEVAAPKEVTRLYDSPAVVKLSQPQTLSFTDGGVVADVVAKGTVVKAGQVVASLEGAAKFDKELQDVRDRLAYYQKKLDAAKAKGAEADIKEAEGKVAEKTKLLNETEAKAAKVRLTSTVAGTVTDVMVTTGAEAKAGAPALKIGDSRKVAELKVAGPDAAALKAGAPVTLQGKAGMANGRVQGVADGVATIELLDDVLKDGEQAKVVKSRVANVIKLPPAAVTKEGAADMVFVLVNGEAKQRKVTVVDRSASEVLVSGGLAPGDSVIVSTPAPLKDGTKAAAQ